MEREKDHRAWLSLKSRMDDAVFVHSIKCSEAHVALERAGLPLPPRWFEDVVLAYEDDDSSDTEEEESFYQSLPACVAADVMKDAAARQRASVLV